MSSQPAVFKVFSKVMDLRWNICNQTKQFSQYCNELLDIHDIPRGTYYLDGRRYNEEWGVVVYLPVDHWEAVLQFGRETVARVGRAAMKRRTRKLMRSDYFKGCSKARCQEVTKHFVQFVANHAALFGGTPPKAYDVARKRGALVDMKAERFHALYDTPEKKPRRRTRKKLKRKKKKPAPKQVRSEFDGHDLVPLPAKTTPAQPLGIEQLRRGIEQLWSARDARNVVEKANGEKAIVM